MSKGRFRSRRRSTSAAVAQFKRNRSFKKFIGLELGLTIVSFVLAYFIAGFIYPFNPALYMFIGSFVPQPFSASGYQTAYLIGAGIVWLVSNTGLYATGLRTL